MIELPIYGQSADMDRVLKLSDEYDFPVVEKAAERILSLPMYPELTEYLIRYVFGKIIMSFHVVNSIINTVHAD